MPWRAIAGCPGFSTVLRRFLPCLLSPETLLFLPPKRGEMAKAAAKRRPLFDSFSLSPGDTPAAAETPAVFRFFRPFSAQSGRRAGRNSGNPPLFRSFPSVRAMRWPKLRRYTAFSVFFPQSGSFAQSAGRPESISNPWARVDSTAARFSRTALGEPGRFTMRLPPRMPAWARESMARGVT